MVHGGLITDTLKLPYRIMFTLCYKSGPLLELSANGKEGNYVFYLLSYSSVACFFSKTVLVHANDGVIARDVSCVRVGGDE